MFWQGYHLKVRGVFYKDKKGKYFFFLEMLVFSLVVNYLLRKLLTMKKWKKWFFKKSIFLETNKALQRIFFFYHYWGWQFVCIRPSASVIEYYKLILLKIMYLIKLTYTPTTELREHMECIKLLRACNSRQLCYV